MKEVKEAKEAKEAKEVKEVKEGTREKQDALLRQATSHEGSEGTRRKRASSYLVAHDGDIPALVVDETVSGGTHGLWAARLQSARFGVTKLLAPVNLFLSCLNSHYRISLR